MEHFLSFSKAAATLGLGVAEWALLASGIILALGVVGEYKLPFWSHRLRYFEWMVAIGVTAEILCDGGVFLFSSRLQQISDVEVAEAQTASGGALVEAEQARERAAKANERAAHANERAARIEQENLKLRARMAPLYITKSQQSELSRKLSEIPGTVVNLITPPGLHILPDPRSGERVWLAFAAESVKARGWDIRLLITTDPIVPGITVRVRRGSDRSVKEIADSIVKAFESVGVGAAAKGPDFDGEAERPIGYGSNAFRQWDDSAKIWIFVGS